MMIYRLYGCKIKDQFEINVTAVRSETVHDREREPIKISEIVQFTIWIIYVFENDFQWMIGFKWGIPHHENPQYSAKYLWIFIFFYRNLLFTQTRTDFTWLNSAPQTHPEMKRLQTSQFSDKINKRRA